MPPIKKLTVDPSAAQNRRVATRSFMKPPTNQELPKRKAGTPPKLEAEHKRQVLVDITNEKKLQANADNLKNVAVNLKLKNSKATKPAAKAAPKQPENARPRLTRCSTLHTRTTTSTTVTSRLAEVKKAVVRPVPSQVPRVNFPEVKPRSGTSSAASSTSSCKGALSRLAIKEEGSKGDASGDSEDSELFVTASESLSDVKPKLKLTSVKVSKDAEKSSQERVVPGVEDFDKKNLNNLFEVGMYAMDVFDYLKSIEEKYRVGDYMKRQSQVQASSRSQLVDWLVELQEHFELNHESLYLAVRLLDHYLARKCVPIAVLQVVGMSCILLAAKYEERYPPSLEDLLFISDYVCSRDQLIRMEQEVLRTLRFELGMPLSYCFLRRYARCINMSLQDLTLARYILELSLTEYMFVSVSESKMACASLLLALRMLGLGGWTPTLEHYTGYKEEDFKHLLPHLNKLLHCEKNSNRHRRVFIKYSDGSFFKVATKKLLKNLSGDDNQ
ncbi:G2/mitotic-specific cyclin-B3 [Bacillus rossius redtenbacheri]|uniref:G2/mitotic-specific cyclin-B3 n=1 Tax=Bacillus rossius redtenbacheri TaxID=93214 RepID=UPI002FDE2D74